MSDDDRLAWVRAGADASPREPGTPATPGQLWHHLLRLPVDKRMAVLAQFISEHHEYYRAFLNDFESRAQIAELEVRRLQEENERLRQLIP